MSVRLISSVPSSEKVTIDDGVRKSLLFLEIQIHAFLLECLESGLPDELLQKVIALFKQEKTATLELENQLVDLYRSRVEMVPRLEALLREMGSTPLQQALEEILFQLDRHLCRMNGLHTVTKAEIDQWQTTLRQFVTDFTLALKQATKSAWKSDYPKVMRKVEILILYRTWEALLPGAIREKAHFFQTFSSEKKSGKALRKWCVPYFQKDPAQTSTKVIAEIERVKARVFAAEKALRTQSRLSSLVYSLLSDNPYTRFYGGLVEGLRKITQRDLSPNFLNFSKGTAAAGAFALELVLWEAVGISYKMLQTVSHQFMPSIDSWMNFCHHFGFDEKWAISTFTTVEKCVECSTYTAFTAYSLGFTPSVLVTAPLGYGFGVATTTLTELTLKQVFRDNGFEPKSSTAYPLLSGVAQMVAFPLGSLILHEFYLPRRFLYSGPIFQNRNGCAAEPQRCREEACRFLGASPTSSQEAIQKLFHNLSKQYHPDRNPTGHSMYQLISTAKEACLNQELRL